MKRKLLVFLLSLLMIATCTAALTACGKCEHSGGTATCNAQAICAKCNKPYGGYDQTEHGKLQWQTTASKHTQICAGCGTVVVATANHTLVNGACTVCDYDCPHTGGTATCINRATCETCGSEYGAYDAAAHSNLVWEKTATTHLQKCGGCGKVVKAQAAHTWSDGVCSVCGYACEHVGNAATCSQQVTCTRCGEICAIPNENNHTSAPIWEKTATTHKKYYPCCGAVVIDVAAHVMTDGVCAVCEYACVHTGGTATCTDKAVCTACGTAYGGFAANNHTGELDWETTETGHKKCYACCGLTIIPEEAHVMANGVCAVCGYICQHTGGVATCEEKATCTKCGTKYGEIAANNHTGSLVWEKTAATHKKYYSCCGAAVIESAAHVMANGVCAVCEYACAHTGGTANCQSKAVCTKCGAEYGELVASKHAGVQDWVSTATTHKKCYTCCGVATTQEGEHDWLNGLCDVCGYTCQHTGGTATCEEKAICEWCGSRYGDYDQNTHTGTPVVTKTATTHGTTYSCCGAVIVAATPHLWNNGQCLDCEYVCQHSGGTATCQKEARCEICGAAHGDLDADNHEGFLTWSKTATQHKQYYTCCGAVVIAPTSHTWNGGVCEGCDYVCAHRGGAANCHEKAICVTCGSEYGDFAPGNHTGSPIWEKTADSHRKYYSCCGVTAENSAAHTWKNGACSVCEYVCQHTGGTATCTEKATCVNCGAKYGDVNANNHVQQPTWEILSSSAHKAYYACCDTETVAAQGHNYVDGKCKDCEYVCVHTGGTATCTGKAVCTACGMKYGEIDAATHAQDLTWEKTQTAHKLYYPCCETVLVDNAAHVWHNGACLTCEYECVHTGGTANCQEKAVCETCDQPYGELNTKKHAQTSKWTKTATTHERYFPCCGTISVKLATHKWSNGTCTLCAYACEHSGDAICTICGKVTGESTSGSYTDGRHVREQGTTNYDYIAGGRTDYVVVTPATLTSDVRTAYTEFNTLTKDATGLQLTKIADGSVSASQKYISLGWTEQAKAAVAAGTLKVPGYKWDATKGEIVSDSTTEPLKTNGFVIKTVGENIFIVGGTDVGNIFGVYQLAKSMYHFTQYTYKIYYIDRNVKNLKLPNLNYVEDPDIGERMANWGCIYYNTDAAHRLGYRLQYNEILVSDYHTSFTFLPPSTYYAAHPEWYNGTSAAESTQLCYTAHGSETSYNAMVEEMARVMWDLLKEEPNKRDITLTQQDHSSWCNCSENSGNIRGCQQTIADYGNAPMATQLFFANDVTERIEQYRLAEQPDRLPIIVHVFAYHRTIPAPVEAEKVNGEWVPADGYRGKAIGHENLSVYMAIYGSQNYQLPLEDAKNATAKDLIEQYRVIANHVSFWPYTTYFDNFFVPFDSFAANQNHYKYYAAAGAEILFNQGQHNNGAATGFSHLKTFMFGVWGWDVNVNYNTLVDAYFENVYGSSNGAMRKMYEEIRAFCAYRLEQGLVNESIYGSGASATLFPTQMLFQWLDYCEQAYEEIAHLQATDPTLWANMHDAITLESLLPRYFIGKYHVNLLPKDERAAFRTAFAEDCEKVNLTRVDEGTTIEKEIASWA